MSLKLGSNMPNGGAFYQRITKLNVTVRHQ